MAGAVPGAARGRFRRGRPGAAIGETAGEAAIEMAFVLPVLLALTLGVLDGGRALLALNSVEKLAKEGARYASVRGSEYASPATETDVANYLEAKAAALVPSQLSVAVAWPDGDNDPGSTVVVTVNYPFDAIFLPFQTFNFSHASTLNIMR